MQQQFELNTPEEYKRHIRNLEKRIKRLENELYEWEQSDAAAPIMGQTDCLEENLKLREENQELRASYSSKC